MKNDNRSPMQKAAFALSIIGLQLTIASGPLAKFLHVSQWFFLGIVWLAWIVFACFYRIQVWRQLKQEARAIEDKYEAKMKQLMVESSEAIKSQ